jgi:hypothetical protein
MALPGTLGRAFSIGKENNMPWTISYICTVTGYWEYERTCIGREDI